jgi:hypothetical protein
LPGDVVKLLLPRIDLFHERRSWTTLSRSRGEVPNFVLKLFRSLTHPPNSAVKTKKRRLQLALEFFDGEFKRIGPEVRRFATEKTTASRWPPQAASGR